MLTSMEPIPTIVHLSHEIRLSEAKIHKLREERRIAMLAARAEGHTVQEIGDAASMSKQAAMQIMNFGSKVLTSSSGLPTMKE